MIFPGAALALLPFPGLPATGLQGPEPVAAAELSLRPRIDAAIERAVGYLLRNQQRDGSFPGRQDR